MILKFEQNDFNFKLTPDTRYPKPYFPFELRFAFLNVGSQAFLCILRLKELLLQFALEGQRGLEGNLGAGLHAAFDAPNGARGFLRRGELPRVGLAPVPETAPRFGFVKI